MTFWKWSKTAATNATADSTAPWPEGMAPSQVNDSARAVMAAAAKYRDDTSGALTTGGTATAFTATTNQGFTTLALLDGHRLTLRFSETSGAAPTLNVDGLGAKALQTSSGAAIPTGMILDNSVWGVTYDNSIPAFLVQGVPSALPDGAVHAAAALASDVVTTAKILDLNVTTGKLANLGVTAGKLATDAVETAKIKDANVTKAKLASDVIGTQAQMETGTATDTLIAIGLLKNHPLVPKAWGYITISGTTATVAAGSGVASVAFVSGTNWTVTLSTAMSSTNYGVLATTNAAARIIATFPAAVRTTTTFQVTFYRTDDSAGNNPDSFAFAVFGDQ
jgi:hypothetical protein